MLGFPQPHSFFWSDGHFDVDTFEMSRALDPEILQSIPDDDPRTVYKAIVEALSTRTEGHLEIEFLGKSHPLPPGCNALIDGDSIAIPKAKLVQAFVVARKLFVELVAEDSNSQDSALRDATAVILLMDPEHLTAANARKRIIQRAKENIGRSNGSTEELETILAAELLFIDSYLTSRLHRHTKSPTLWAHRRWVLEVVKNVHKLSDREVFTYLTTIVMVSAERHPRNYYAWSHMRWLLQEFHSNNTLPEHVPQVTAFDNSKLLSVVKAWCLAHPGDTSGYSFLLFCLSRIPNSDDRRRASSAVCAEVLRVSIAFKWTHESIWAFLRTVVASGYVEDREKVAFFQATESTSAVPSQGSSIVVAAQHWVMKYEQQAET